MSTKKPAGMLLVTHLDFGQSLIRAMEFILGPQEGFASVGVETTTNVDETVDAIRKALEKVDKGSGVLVLTDMFGGTPTNLSLSLFNSHAMEVVTGVNLPMALKAVQCRDLSLAKLAREVREAGLKGIVVPGEMLKKRQAK